MLEKPIIVEMLEVLRKHNDNVAPRQWHTRYNPVIVRLRTSDQKE
jgi:hypothetical protein